MLPSIRLARRVALRPSLTPSHALGRRLAQPCICAYATSATDKPLPPPPPKSGGSGRGGNPQDPSTWRRPTPLATAQTLTLFSTSPEALLLALRSTVQGMAKAVARAGTLQGEAQDVNSIQLKPPPERKYTLLFALSKELPRDVLAEAVQLLRGGGGAGGTEGEALITTRLGMLSASVPVSLIPPATLNPDAPPLAPRTTIFSAALSLLPASHAVPFRSVIHGKQAVQVGRWPQNKESWADDRGKEKIDAAVEARAGAAGRIDAGAGETTGWRQLWGRENISGELPPALEALRSGGSGSGAASGQVLSTLVFSNPTPQGLLEGLDGAFPAASCAGAVASATPFETGRAQTLFYKDAGAGIDEVSEAGAVGVALVSGGAPAAASAAGRAAGAAAGAMAGAPAAGLRTTVRFEGLRALGPRRAITGARGNIISALEGGNATQQFLRDVQAAAALQKEALAQGQGHAQGEQGASAEGQRAGQEGAELALKTGMSAAEARDISKGMSKEDEYYLGVFAAREGGGELDEDQPILLARILSGSPSRGSLSLETDVQLEVELGGASSSSSSSSTNASAPPAPRYAQFYALDPLAARAGAQFPSALDIPGPRPADWASPRFLFVTPSANTVAPGDGAGGGAGSGAGAGASEGTGAGGAQQQQQQTSGAKKAKVKAQVLALPNMFVAASERGFIRRAAGASSPSASPSGPGEDAAHRAQAHVTLVPGSCAMLSLEVGQ